MRRFILLGLLSLAIACSEDAAAPRLVPSFANAVILNACNTTSYPNYGGIWAVTLNPSWQQVDSSNAAGNWLKLDGQVMEALVWRDNASFPGNQMYCVDTTASFTKLSWQEGDPANAIGLLGNFEQPEGTQWPNKRAVQAFRRGTAHPYVVYTPAPSIRDTATIVVVP